jgi:uncharacterized protein
MRTNSTNEQPAASHRKSPEPQRIGVALARVFARHGHELALIARREERLHALADEIAATGARRPMVIVADLLKTGAARLIGEALAAQGAERQFFVNNAGFGLVGLASARDRDEQPEMIDLNVRALTELSFAFVDSLARHRGGLLNVGSMAGFLPGPGMAVYYATKAYVLSYTEALHSELKSLGIRVAVLCPGPVPTEFAERAGISGGRLGPRIIGRLCGGGRVSRPHGRAPDGGSGLYQQTDQLTRIIPRRLVLRVVGSGQSRRRSAQPT